MTLSFETVVVQEKEPVVAQVDGEVVMLSERQGAYFGLNGIGSEIWAAVAQPCRIEDLCQSLQGNYQGDPAAIRADIMAFLEKMLAHKLIRIVDKDDSGT